MEGLTQIISEHPFFAGLEERLCDLVRDCAKNLRFEAGQYISHEGETVDRFYLIRQGRVALTKTMPGGSAMTFQTISGGQVVGIAWMVSPYRWPFDAKAIEMTHAIALDVSCLREKCEVDDDLGYAMMKRTVPILFGRLPLLSG